MGWDEIDAAFRTRCSFRPAGNERDTPMDATKTWVQRVDRHSPRKSGSGSSCHCPVFEAWLLSFSVHSPSPSTACCLAVLLLVEAEGCM